MSSIVFKHGRRLMLDGRQMLVVRIVNGSQVTLEDVESLALRIYGLDDLLGLYHLRRLTAPDGVTREISELQRIQSRPMSDYPEAVQQVALRRKRYLDALRSEGRIIWSPSSLEPRLAELARRFNDASPPSASTVYRWHKRQQKSLNEALLQKSCRAAQVSAR